MRVNRLTVKYGGGYFRREDTADITANGGYEATVTLDTSDRADAEAKADALLAELAADPEPIITASGLIPPAFATPGIDTIVGDRIYVVNPAGGTEQRRLVALTVETDAETGLAIFTPELNRQAVDPETAASTMLQSLGDTAAISDPTPQDRSTGTGPASTPARPMSFGGLGLPPQAPARYTAGETGFGLGGRTLNPTQATGGGGGGGGCPEHIESIYTWGIPSTGFVKVGSSNLYLGAGARDASFRVTNEEVWSTLTFRLIGQSGNFQVASGTPTGSDQVYLALDQFGDPGPTGLVNPYEGVTNYTLEPDDGGPIPCGIAYDGTRHYIVGVERVGSRVDLAIFRGDTSTWDRLRYDTPSGTETWYFHLEFRLPKDPSTNVGTYQGIQTEHVDGDAFAGDCEGGGGGGGGSVTIYPLPFAMTGRMRTGVLSLPWRVPIAGTITAVTLDLLAASTLGSVTFAIRNRAGSSTYATVTATATNLQETSTTISGTHLDAGDVIFAICTAAGQDAKGATVAYTFTPD